MDQQPIDYVKILQVGPPGLVFLLALLAFYLLSNEQKREGAARENVSVVEATTKDLAQRVFDDAYVACEWRDS
jgi:hypothetical protein